MALASILLAGCATRTVVFDTDAPRGALAAQPGRRGLVIAAPHGTSDVRTDAIAAELAQRTGFGVVIATGFATEARSRDARPATRQARSSSASAFARSR